VELGLHSVWVGEEETVHLIQVMYSWHKILLQFLSSIAVVGNPSDGAASILSANSVHASMKLLPRSNVCTIPRADGAIDVLKVYDYRCSPGAVLPTAREDRRSPDVYRYSNLGVQSLCSWAGRVDDSLDIIVMLKVVITLNLLAISFHFFKSSKGSMIETLFMEIFGSVTRCSLVSDLTLT
jgi:hypothetical protein